jgi:serine/threonine protein kinase
MREGRWTTVTDSEFAHERRGLEAIRDLLPDADPWLAWSNFSFTANSGHVREVDLLVIAPSGVYLIELKDWHGRLESRNGVWLQTQPSGRQISHGNPLHLANQKAKELAGLLADHNGGRRPQWVTELICLTDDSLRVSLPLNERGSVHSISSLVDLLRRPPADDRHRVTGQASHALERLLKQIGVVRRPIEYKVGPYKLEKKAFDTGPSWADYLGHHDTLPESVRVRVYLTERGSAGAQRESIERAARREAAVLSGFRHPGVVQLKQFDAHPGSGIPGPALIFEYDPRTLRLDEYLAQYAQRLDLLARVALVRQLAETVRSAHRRRIYHRALAARAIHVGPREHRPGAEDAAWLNPRLQLSDWQLAVRRSGNEAAARFAPTSLSSALGHLATAADPYLAPELTASRPDPIALDVYGLGVLTYLLATGQPPAASQAEVAIRIEAGEGLTPSAVVDGIPKSLDELVQLATRYRPVDRLATVDEFIDYLELVEDEITAPAAEAEETGPVSEHPATEAETDPLEATVGDVVGSRWQVLRRLGTGSTSRAFLVRDLPASRETDSAERDQQLAVLKVALSDGRAAVLRREAEIMRGLRPDSRIIQLREREPLEIAGRTVLVLEYVGNAHAALEELENPGSKKSHGAREDTVGRLLRERGRLTIDQLDSYGDYLFGAADFLEGEGIWHRDVKPDNIAIRVRPRGTKELVLLDFSLAGYPAKEIGAGTEGYLDPFLGTVTRSVYDAHAERYAIAVTLHEMASGELPVWGDGKVVALQTDPKQEPYPRIASEAFEPALREPLTEFFRRALHRDAAKRFPDLKPMHDAWKKIFLDVNRTRPSRHPADGRTAPDELAAKAAPDTPIELSGLSDAAKAFAYSIGIENVGELIEYSRGRLINQPGLGNKTLVELQRRIKQWRLAFARQPASPLDETGREDAKRELAGLSELESRLVEQGLGDTDVELPDEQLRTVSLDTVVSVLVPERRRNGANQDEIELLRILLRLPNETGELPGTRIWPRQKDVAALLDGRDPASVSRVLKPHRKRWSGSRYLRAARAEILELLAQRGRAATAVELADALVVRRGTRQSGSSQRRALGLAVVRAIVEAEELDPQSRAFMFSTGRGDHAMAGGGVLALEVGEDDSPDTPSAPALVDYVAKLARVADRLAALETLPTPAMVLGELGAVATPSGTLDWDERRIVQLAAGAAQNAAATPRLEIYPRDLSLIRALRLTQAGLVRSQPGRANEEQPGLRPEDVHERVLIRFPELSNALPTGAKLTEALTQAGFDLELVGTGAEKRYVTRSAQRSAAASNLTSLRRPTSRGLVPSTRPNMHHDDPEIGQAARADEQLTTARGRDGFRVLTVQTRKAEKAEAKLAGDEFAVEPVSVAGLLIAALHEQVDPRPLPTWETILSADVAEPGSRSAMKFAEYVQTAWGAVETRLAGKISGGARAVAAADCATGATGTTGPVLLTEGAFFARYHVIDVLERLAERSRHGGRPLWLLCPQADPTSPPQLGSTVVPFQSSRGEWIVMNDMWVEGKHRDQSAASGAGETPRGGGSDVGVGGVATGVGRDAKR